MNIAEQTIVSHLFLVPTGSGHKTYPLLILLGATSGKMKSYNNFGAAPVRFITQRGPFEDGSTLLDMRYETRTSQILIEHGLSSKLDFIGAKERLLDLLRPNRSFKASSSPTPAIYRRYYQNGHTMRGGDAVVENGSNQVYIPHGRFIDWGGMVPGVNIVLDGVTYTVAEVLNDYSLSMTTNYAGADNDNALWSYVTRPAYRDLYFVVEQGPQFNHRTDQKQWPVDGYKEVVRMISHNPFFYGAEQSETWGIEENLGDLSFDGESAWFSLTSGAGRWLFSSESVIDTINVVYNGHVRARPDFVIQGPAKGLSIKQVTTNQYINFSLDIAPGEVVTISVANQSATRSDGTDVTVYISGDLALFGLEPDPIAPDNINQIQVSFQDANPSSSAAMLWRNTFDGD